MEGSNGEYVYLSDEERIELVKKCCSLVPKDGSKIILGGSGCECKPIQYIFMFYR